MNQEKLTAIRRIARFDNIKEELARTTYADLWLSMQLTAMGYPRYDEKCPSASVELRWDGSIVFRYNPYFYDLCTDGLLKFVVLHELLHIYYKHLIRGRGKNSNLWNISADIVVNEKLTARGLLNTKME